MTTTWSASTTSSNHTKTYHDFCQSEGIEPLDLDY